MRSQNRTAGHNYPLHPKSSPPFKITISLVRESLHTGKDLLSFYPLSLCGGFIIATGKQVFALRNQRFNVPRSYKIGSWFERPPILIQVLQPKRHREKLQFSALFLGGTIKDEEHDQNEKSSLSEHHHWTGPHNLHTKLWSRKSSTTGRPCFQLKTHSNKDASSTWWIFFIVEWPIARSTSWRGSEFA